MNSAEYIRLIFMLILTYTRKREKSNSTSRPVDVSSDDGRELLHEAIYRNLTFSRGRFLVRHDAGKGRRMRGRVVVAGKFLHVRVAAFLRKLSQLEQFAAVGRKLGEVLLEALHDRRQVLPNSSA